MRPPSYRIWGFWVSLLHGETNNTALQPGHRSQLECHGIEQFDAYQEKVLDETGFTYMRGAFHLAPFGEKYLF
jgi:hypothetical protein